MSLLDGGEFCQEIIGLSEGPLGEQELPAGSAQGFASLTLLLLVLGRELMGFQYQGLDAGKDLIDTPA